MHIHILVKTEALSQLTYLMSVLPRPSNEQITEIDRIMFKFIWGTVDKIKRKTLRNVLKKSGLMVPDVSIQSASLKITWVKKFIDDCCNSKWKAVVKDKLTVTDGITIFHCEGNVKQLSLYDNFWAETADVWYKISGDLDTDASGSQLLSKPLWQNRVMQLESNPNVRKQEFIRRGILTIQDLYHSDHKRILTVNELESKYGFGHFLTWQSLLRSIPSHISRVLARDKPGTAEQLNSVSTLEEVGKTAKWSYKIILQQSNPTIPANCQGKRKNELALDQEFKWEETYDQLYASTQDFKLRWLQFRIWHRIITTNDRLAVYGLRETDDCDRCPGVRESIQHVFLHCSAVKGTNPALKKPSNIPEIYAKIFGRFH